MSRTSHAPSLVRGRFAPIVRLSRPAVLRIAVPVAIGCLALAGCSSTPEEEFVALNNVEVRHPIVLTDSTKRLDVAPLTGGKGIDPLSRVEIAKFLRRYKQRGEGPVIVSVPRGMRGSRDVAAAVNSIRLLVQNAGLPPSRMVVVEHRRQKGIEPSLMLSYKGFDAVGPECGDWSEDVVRNRENVPYPNFGCAYQRNLAAMLAYPTDIEIPAAETPRSSERNGKVWKKYIDGELAREDAGAKSTIGK